MNYDSQLKTILMTYALATTKDIDHWAHQAEHTQQTLFQWLIQHQKIDSKALTQACATYFKKPIVDIDLLSNATLYQINYMLIICDLDKRYIVINNPADLSQAYAIALQYRGDTTIQFAHYAQLKHYYQLLLKTHLVNTIEIKQMLDIKKIIQCILSCAIYNNASDIHFEQYKTTHRIRLRIDGLLHHLCNIPTDITDTLLSCLKVQAKLDIAIKKTPQDGRLVIKSTLNDLRDARVCSYPTLHGEKIVVRLLDTQTPHHSIASLNLPTHIYRDIDKAIQAPQGLILITGPTGSGKTTTLYAILQQINQTHRNISTIEDPIEIELYGINQSQINPCTGFNFSNALRVLLRQDPDVIMIGEIRDKATADMAIRAAQTGHLVISTLHTNHAAAAITRLSNMGIQRALLAESLSLIIAQRLVGASANIAKVNRAIYLATTVTMASKADLAFSK